MRRRQTLATLRAPPLQHKAAALRGHTSAEAVGLSAPTIVRLECPLRHDCSHFLLQTKRLRLASNEIRVKESGLPKTVFYRLISSPIPAAKSTRHPEIAKMPSS